MVPDLERAFENLLRTLNVDESLINALRINMITDRETFIGLDDSEAGFKSIGPDLGIDLTNGGLAHKKRDVSSDFRVEAGSPCIRSQASGGCRG